MREQFVLAVDIGALFLIVVALWLTAYRRSILGAAFGLIGITALTGMMTMRAVPAPTRQELADHITGLGQQISGLRQQVTDLSRQLTAEQAARGKAEADIVATRLAIEVRAFERTLALLATGSTRSYSIAVDSNTERVKDLRGRYYIINLLDSKSALPLLFAKSRHQLVGEGVRQAESAYQQLVAEVISMVPQGWQTRLFVRGGATAEPFETAPPALGSEFGSVRVRLPDDKDVYGELGDAKPFASVIENADLPQLRAAFLRRLLVGTEGEEKIEILHQQPSSSNEERARRVELILYLGPQ